MSRLRQLYEAMILEHNRNPRNFRVISECSHSSHGKNPLCGDDFYVFVKLNEGVIVDISFHGYGCAISKSSGSLMTECLLGKTVTEALAYKDLFIKLVTQELQETEKQQLGKLTIFEGVKSFPVRVKCAALVWRALEDALENNAGEVTTE